MSLLEFYFRPKRWERNGIIYKYLGVILFKRFIIKLGQKVGQDSTKPGNYFLGTRNIAGVKIFERQTRYNELMHLPGIIVSILCMIGTSSIIINLVCCIVLIINFHPFLLQRYNRSRIYKLLEL
jgi:hypothetical protein